MRNDNNNVEENDDSDDYNNNDDDDKVLPLVLPAGEEPVTSEVEGKLLGPVRVLPPMRAN